MRLRRALGALLFAALTVAGLAAADTIPVKSAELRADDEAYVLNAEFDLAFNPTLEEALDKGVALSFVLEFELVRLPMTMTRSTWGAITLTASWRFCVA